MLIRLLPFLVFFGILQAQNTLSGYVFADDVKNQLPGANVYWVNTQLGTVTNIDGYFSLDKHPKSNQLVISYVGFISDTITISSNKMITHVLRSNENANLDEVVVSQRKKSSQLSFLSTRNVLNVSSEELLKAACCNLSESFETNPAIDVNFDNALTWPSSLAC